MNSNVVLAIPSANGNIPHTEEQKQAVIQRAAEAYAKYLDALGFDWKKDPNSTNTPLRVARAFVEDLAAGCYQDPPKITSFDNTEKYTGMVFQGGIPVKSLCSHHHLPFIGVAHVAYIPSETGQVIGLSKLNRVVEFYSRRPQIQEGLTSQVHKAIDSVCIKNEGVAVIISATHTCACLRGIKHDGCVMGTSKLSGEFMSDAAVRSEFYQFVSNWSARGSYLS